MSKIQKYEVLNASNHLRDRFDADNFYPYDGLETVYDEDLSYGDFSGLDTDGGGLDIEFSDAIGDFFKRFKKSDGATGLTSSQGTEVGTNTTEKDSLLNRLFDKDERAKRVAEREKRRKIRLGNRLERKNMRNENQVSFYNSISDTIKDAVNKIVAKNPVLQEPIAKIQQGIADSAEVEVVKTVIDEGKKMIETGTSEPPVIEVKDDGNVEVKDSWWSKASTGVKVAIIGGGVAVLGLGVWALTRKKIN